MMKPLLVAALAIVGLSFTADNAQAGRRCCRAQRNCGCASACNTCANNCNTCSNGCNACGTNSYNSGQMADPNVAPPPPQQTNATAYQSYSYEPGSQVATNQVMAAPAYYGTQMNQRSTSLDQFRGERKVLNSYR